MRNKKVTEWLPDQEELWKILEGEGKIAGVYNQNLLNLHIVKVLYFKKKVKLKLKA